MSTMQYFGKRYDAPAYEDMAETPTPVGMRCSHCTEKIAEGDDGITMPHWHSVGMTIEPIHLECWMRSILGSVEHLAGTCSCYNDDSRDHCGPGESWREQGRRVMEWIEKHGTT